MKSNDNSWQTISSHVVYKNPWYQVREDEVVRPDGREGKFCVVELTPSAEIVAVTEKQEVYLIGQHRYTVGKFSWTVPGGSAEEQDLLETAKRELQEETGLVSDEWEEIGEQYALNASTNKIDHIFIAKNTRQTESNMQNEDGITHVEKVPFKKVLEMIKTGEIKDSETIAALTLAALHLGIIS